jgi:hypothetical protein
MGGSLSACEKQRFCDCHENLEGCKLDAKGRLLTHTDTVAYEGTYYHDERVVYWVSYEKDCNVEEQEIFI